jgi:hypothetical protein
MWNGVHANESAPDSIESRDARSNSPPPKSAQSQGRLRSRQAEWLLRARGATSRLERPLQLLFYNAPCANPIQFLAEHLQLLGAVVKFAELRRCQMSWLSECLDLNVNEHVDFIFDGTRWCCHRGRPPTKLLACMQEPERQCRARLNSVCVNFPSIGVSSDSSS